LLDEEDDVPETISDTRQLLTSHVARFREEGLDAEPVVFIVLAAAIAPMGLSVTIGGGDWVLASVLQVAFVWSIIPGSIGLFRAVFAKEVRGVRFLADASYWIYLVHLPVEIWLQAVLVGWDVGPWLKYGVVVLVSMALGLTTYRAFVRYSPIGWVLNGPRSRPGRSQEPDVIAAARP